MQVFARVHGIDKLMRDLAKTSDLEKVALRRGIHEAAEFLMKKIVEKIGIYQPTGGTGGGPWARLTWETNKEKLRKYGFSNKPLLATGRLKDSFYVRDSSGVSLMSSVGNDDPVMAYHVYGSPSTRLPPRDPMLVISNEQRDQCRKIIIERIYEAYK